MDTVEAKNKIVAHLQNARRNLDLLDKELDNPKTLFEKVDTLSYLVGHDMNSVEKLARRVD